MDSSIFTSFLNEFLLKVDAVAFQIYQAFYSTGTGNIPVFGGISSLTMLMLSPLVIVMAMQWMHLAHEWVQSQRVDPKYITEIIKILFFIGAMIFVSRWGNFSGSTMSGLQNKAIGGVSVQGLFAQVDGGQKQAVAAISALDVISVYEEQLHGPNGAGNARYKKVMDTLRKKNPNLDKVLAARDQAAAGQGGRSFGTAERAGMALQAVAGQGWTALKEMVTNMSISGAVTSLATSGTSLILGMVAKVGAYAFYLALVWVTYFMFALSVMKALLIFAVYLKIAILLAFVLIPPAIAMAYFAPLRGMAMNVVKQLLVLIMLSAAYGQAYQVIFSQDNLQKVVTMALANGAAGDIADAAHNKDTIDEIDAMVITVTEIIGSDNFGEKSKETQAVAYFAAMDVSTIRKVFLAISRGVMVLGMMVILLGKVYEIISGALDGGYDPTDLLRRQGMETSASMGPSGGGR